MTFRECIEMEVKGLREEAQMRRDYAARAPRQDAQDRLNNSADDLAGVAQRLAIYLAEAPR